jgi:hypothetical protein
MRVLWDLPALAGARAGNQLRLKVSGFALLSPAITSGIQAEALDLGRFLGPSSVDVQIS